LVEPGSVWFVKFKLKDVASSIAGERDVAFAGTCKPN
jgi:hypothetical protein